MKTKNLTQILFIALMLFTGSFFNNTYGQATLSVCSGETVTANVGLINTSCGGAQGPAGSISVQPFFTAEVTTTGISFAEISFYPTETTTYTVTQNATVCGVPTTISDTFIVEVEDCAPPTDQELTVCSGETVTGNANLIGIPIPGSCQTQGPFGFVSVEPSETATVENSSAGLVAFYPTETTTYTVTHNGYWCGTPTTLSTTFLVEVEDCGNTEPDCSANTGTIFFENCGGTQFFFIEAADGTIYDPYYGPDVYFVEYEGQTVNFDFVPNDNVTPCVVSDQAITITCINDITPPVFDNVPGTYDFAACPGDVIELLLYLPQGPFSPPGNPGCINGGGIDLSGAIDPDGSGDLTLNGSIDATGLWTIYVNGAGSLTYNLDLNGPDQTQNCTGSWTVNVTIDESCGGNTDDNTEIFNDYSWLTNNNIVDPNNCSNETVTVYNAGTYNFIFVETAAGGTLYFQDGTFYCADASNFSCISAYGLSTVEVTWTCGEGGGSETGCLVEDPLSLPFIQGLINNAGTPYSAPPETPIGENTGDCVWTSEIVQLEYNGSSYFRVNVGVFNGFPCPASEYEINFYDCEGNLVCQTGFIPFTPTDPLLCEAITGINGTVIWTNENNVGGGTLPIFTDYPWLSELINTNDCTGTVVDVYTQGTYNFICVQSPSGNTFYFQDGSFYCADSPGFSCVEAYGLTEMVDTWTCGDTGPEPPNPSENDPVFEDYPWLNNLVNEANCISETINVYTTGAYDFILIETATASTLYFQDGTYYCADASNFSCVEAYGLTEMVGNWTCGESDGNGGGTEGDFGEYTWLNEVIQGNCELNESVTVYTSGVYSFLYVSAANGLGTLYFQDGTLYCSDANNFSCVEAYGLMAMDSQLLWTCGEDKPVVEPTEEIEMAEEVNADKKGIEAFETELNFNVFPNPSNGQVFIEVAELESEQVINVFDLSGKMIQEVIIDSYTFNTKIEMDLTDMPKGVYLVQLKTDVASEVKRLMIQ